jgi:hypothetical protein
MLVACVDTPSKEPLDYQNGIEGSALRGSPAAREPLPLDVAAFRDHQIDCRGVLPELAYLLILFRMISR